MKKKILSLKKDIFLQNSFPEKKNQKTKTKNTYQPKKMKKDIYHSSLQISKQIRKRFSKIPRITIQLPTHSYSLLNAIDLILKSHANIVFL